MRPNSRGVIHLTGSDPADPVSIDPNYLNDPQDLKDLIAGLSLAREIGNSLALRPFTGPEVAPGPLSVAELEQFFRNGLGTHWHQSGTAKMGRDAMSVVDGQLKVYGVDRLRIADASIMPRVSDGAAYEATLARSLLAGVWNASRCLLVGLSRLALFCCWLPESRRCTAP